MFLDKCVDMWSEMSVEFSCSYYDLLGFGGHRFICCEGPSDETH